MNPLFTEWANLDLISSKLFTDLASGSIAYFFIFRLLTGNGELELEELVDELPPLSLASFFLFHISLISSLALFSLELRISSTVRSFSLAVNDMEANEDSSR